MSLHHRLAAAEEIRALLARRRISQREFGAALNLSQSGVSRRLDGKTPFTLDELAAAADFLDVPVSAFFGEARAS